MVQKYFWRLRKLFPRSRNNSLRREILWKSRNILKNRENFFIGQTIFFNGWEFFGRLRINFVDQEFFFPSRIFLSIEKFPVDREIFLSIEKFPVDREISCWSRNYLSIENFSVNRQIGKRIPISVRRRSSPAQQVETDDVPLSELIGYQIYPHKWNFCTISILRGWSLIDIPIGCFAIFLSSSVIKILPIRVTPGDHCGRSISKIGKAPHSFLDWYLRSFRTKFEVNP